VTDGRAPRSLRWLGALLVLYLAYPVGAFFYRLLDGQNQGWSVPGLWPDAMTRDELSNNLSISCHAT